jgi:hypothetical protein
VSKDDGGGERVGKQGVIPLMPAQRLGGPTEVAGKSDGRTSEME